MPEIETVQTPTRKPEATHGEAIQIFIFVFLPLVALGIAMRMGAIDLIPLVALSSVFAIAIGFLAIRRSSPIPRGRSLMVVGAEIRQTDEDGNLVASIDASRAYEYQVDRLGHSDDAIVRLIQAGTTMHFYLSDPGGSELRESVLGLRWPPLPNPKR
jgi:hypothetical protein